MSDDQIFARLEKLIPMVERLWKLAVGILLGTFGVFIWGYRLDAARIDHEQRLGKVEGKVDSISNDVSHIKGRLDIAYRHAAPSSFKVWKADPEPPQQQQQ